MISVHTKYKLLIYVFIIVSINNLKRKKADNWKQRDIKWGGDQEMEKVGRDKMGRETKQN